MGTDKQKNNKTIPSHIHTECPGANIIIYGIQRIPNEDHLLRHTTEAAWIQELVTLRPSGLNNKEEKW